LVITGIFVFHQYPIKKKKDNSQGFIKESLIPSEKLQDDNNLEVNSCNSKMVSNKYNNNRLSFYKENLSSKSLYLLNQKTSSL